MSYLTKLTDDCLGIVHTVQGVLTGEDMLAASTVARQLVQNTENFNYELADFSGVTEIRINPEQLEKIVAQDRRIADWRPHAMIVIIAPSAETHALALAWEELVQDLDWNIHISRDRDEALNWLARHRAQARQDLEVEIDRTAHC